ncbi:MAG: hypothetical protein GWP17_06080 [Aquificales bacterium]|nr:hypothetical protein [Aquificales bacterium]
MAPSLTQFTQTILEAVLSTKQENDGISPSLAELAAQFGVGKSQVQDHIMRLMTGNLLYKTPGKSRNLAVVGGTWVWAEPRPYPIKRVGDVLRAVVVYKQSYDGNAPSHRQIAHTLGLSYTGDIKGYMDDLSDAGYLKTAYATDRHIMVVGGNWRYDKDVLAQANPDFYSQGSLLPFD